MTVTKKNVLYFTRIIGVLLVITMSVAVLLSLVNGITKDKIAANEAESTKKAVSELFPDHTELKTEKLCVELDDKTFKGLYEVKSQDTIIGYYAQVAPKGFKGEVGMLVGITKSGQVSGIAIISSGETPGIGDKIERPVFLDKFVGLDAATLKVDTISGATYSSKAVISGTKTALAAYQIIAHGGETA